MARKKNSLSGCLIVLLVAGGAMASLWQKSPALATAAGVAVLAALGIVLYALRPRRCDVCGNVLQRKSYEWTLEGEKKRVCPHCNQTLARRQSKAAMGRYK